VELKSICRVTAVVAVILLIGGLAFAQHRGRHHPMPPGEFGPGAGPMGHMAEELELTEEQRTDIRAIAKRYHDGSLGEALQAHQQAQRELRAVIHDPAAGEQAVLDAARRVSGQGEQIALERHRMALEISQVLTEEQRQKARELREQMSEEGSPGFKQRRRGHRHSWGG
jgi:Spy/CpxP family protein refolding chaperone